MRETASGGLQSPAPSPAAFAERWRALHDQAGRIAEMAQLSPERFEGAIAALPDRIGDAPDWKRSLAWQHIEDIDAMMRPGLAALATITSRGLSAHVPALALWREFYNARGSVMALVDEVPA